MAPHPPMRFSRAIFLTLTQWLAVVVGGLNARAIVILQQRSDEVKHSGLPNAFLHAGDIVAVSAVLVAAAGIGGFAALFATIHLMFRPTRAMPKYILYLLAFCTVWLLATHIAVTIVATGWSAKVTAASNIPQSVIDKIVANTGQHLQYIKTPVVKAYTIVGWFAWLALAIATALEWKAKGQPTAGATNTYSTSTDADSFDKPSTSQIEKPTTQQV